MFRLETFLIHLKAQYNKSFNEFIYFFNKFYFYFFLIFYIFYKKKLIIKKYFDLNWQILKK